MAPQPRKSAFWAQVGFLSQKDLTILVARHFTSTLYAALMLPLLMAVYLGIGQNLAGSGNKYGISSSHNARSLREGLTKADPLRSNVVFVNNGLSGGDIDTVIGNLEEQVRTVGKTPHRARDVVEMGRICTVSFQGNTPCYGAVVFNSSPREGNGGIWNYTLRGDGVLGRKFNVDADDNDPQVYVLPLQRAVDAEIARLGNSSAANDIIGSPLQEQLFTSETDDERRARANRDYHHTFINYMGVAVLLAFFGVSYHLPGYIATERERGMSQLVDAMMSTAKRWEPQAVRMLSYYFSFVSVYFPGWVAGSLILKFMLWKQTSVGIILPYFILSGLASTAQSLMGGTFFRKAQLAGQVCGLAFLLLGVLVQAVPSMPTGAAVVLGLLFAPCNMVLMIKYIARAESGGHPANLVKVPDTSDHNLPAVALWVFLGVQIAVCPFLAAWLERVLHGAAADSRSMWTSGGSGSQPQDAVTVHGLTKTFKPSFLRRLFSFVSAPRPPTVAVNNLSLEVPRGQIVALLGANGCGKSTTLDSIAGLQGFRTGKVTIDASGGVGVAPQKNVLFDEMTVWEHVRLFNQLKAPFTHTKNAEKAKEKELVDLLKGVGLLGKKDAKADNLSGGQKRKLQLAMMLTGGSQVCCVDEVSSGIDPLSRRKIWDILLAERGTRTIILTTHFLDEADLLADKIVIMSKGETRAVGSAVELKAKLGSGFRIYLSNPRSVQRPPIVDGVDIKIEPDSIIYMAPTSALAASIIRRLEAAGISYRVSSPTIEDVFLQTAEEYADVAIPDTHTNGHSKEAPLELLSGRKTSIPSQTLVLLRKRFILLQNNWIPYLIAFLIPIVAAAAMRAIVAGEQQSTCTPVRADQLESMESAGSLFGDKEISVFAGPLSSLSPNNASNWYSSSGGNVTLPLTPVDSTAQISAHVEANRQRIYPGGYWLSSPDTPRAVFYRADFSAMTAAVIAQNLLDSDAYAIRLAVGYVVFDAAIGNAGKTLQLAIFFSVLLAICPAFLAMYPNLERRTNVRSLQYSSGVRVVAQWGSHLLFDFGVMLLPIIAAALIFAFATNGVFWQAGILVPVFLLYIIAAIQLGYIISLLTGSQLATWAAVAAVNGIGLAIYFIAFIFIMNLSDATKAQNNILTAHYVISVFFPLGSLMRAMLVSANVFYQACNGPDFTNPGAMSAFGGPILYLVLQSLLYFAILTLQDSRIQARGFFRGFTSGSSKPAPRAADAEKANATGLHVNRLTKSFGTLRAVSDVSFSILPGTVYALLGPNGAGKSTTISMIRGDIAPGDGDVLVAGHSVSASRAAARREMGVCPQFDALDDLTVVQHLNHYARLRGISGRVQIQRQVEAVIQAVGLQEYRHVLAKHLSGGNKRKLSLGIALTGNPAVILLDEPSSGLDAAAKRTMWSTLRKIIPGRSILLTTHSMEEADALASRAGILAGKMLAQDGVESLRARWGGQLWVHVVLNSAPRTHPDEMRAVKEGVSNIWQGVKWGDGSEAEGGCGQMRFEVPVEEVMRVSGAGREGREGDESESAIGRLLVTLEDHSERLGIRHYSVAPTTLNDVFLAIVGEHQVKEEGYRVQDGGDGLGKKKRNWRRIILGF